MRKMFLMSTALTLGALNPVLAGGPVAVVEEDTPVVEAEPASSGGMLIPLLLLVAVAAAVSGGDDTNPQPSDARLKEAVRRVGTNRLGLGVYQYSYRGMAGIYEGVMAQEVAILHPGAVRHLRDGYSAVDYAMLGLEMKRVA